MKSQIRALVIPILFLLALPALAQEIQFSADIVQADGAATPTLTWDTTPLAADCFASGDWSGSKGGAGNETLPTITTSATYNLSCQWIIAAATLSWTPPTQNADGSALADLAGYRFYYGQSAGGPYPLSSDIDNPGIAAYVVEPLSAGTWFFVATAYNKRGIESNFSNEAFKVIADIDVTESVGVVVNPIPLPPSNLAVD